MDAGKPLEKKDKAKKYDFETPERYGVWCAHGYKCFWDGEPLAYDQMTVDHVIPEYYESRPDELEKIKKEYGLPADFQINSFANWVPAHSGCNSRKARKLYTPSPAMIAALDGVAKRAESARRISEGIAKQPDAGKATAHLDVALKSGAMSVDQILSLLRKLDPSLANSLPPLGVKVHVSGQWRIVRVDDDIAMVTNGRVFGQTPVGDAPSTFWACPTCRNYGPWSGVICLECGRKSDGID